MIGANGSGKSNLIAFFRMLCFMLPGAGNLQTFIQQNGRASSLLHDGPTKTREIEAHLKFVTSSGTNEYAFRLFYAAPDTLIFADERCRFSNSRYTTQAPWKMFAGGHPEAQLIGRAATDNTARVILNLLRRYVVYQFHNTSLTARIKTYWDVSDNLMLKEDAANLGPVLLRLRETQPKYYQRIVETIRQILPFFSDFVLEPEFGKIYLRWREKGSDNDFGAHQASDGMLRTLSLVTLLLQPVEALPSLVVLDEPELGLHPYALKIISGLLKSLALERQIIVATQSASLLEEFEPQDVVVVEREGRSSTFRRLQTEPLKEWLEEYSLGELWNKNVLGGRPKEAAI